MYRIRNKALNTKRFIILQNDKNIWDMLKTVIVKKTDGGWGGGKMK